VSFYLFVLLTQGGGGGGGGGEGTKRSEDTEGRSYPHPASSNVAPCSEEEWGVSTLANSSTKYLQDRGGGRRMNGHSSPRCDEGDVGGVIACL
jgi:hypothetical protein